MMRTSEIFCACRQIYSSQVMEGFDSVVIIGFYLQGSKERGQSKVDL